MAAGTSGRRVELAAGGTLPLRHPSAAGSSEGVATAEPASGATTWSFRPGWLVAATLSLVALGILAPGGLLLIGFLGVIIVAHEGGHLVMARRAGMQPTEFFWGFGPEILAVERNGCRYGVKALFLGGYVKLEGMTPRSELPEGFPESGTFRAASHRGRLAAILAGPFVNLAMAVVAFGAVGLLQGRSPAAAARLGVGNVWLVISATGQALWTWGANIGAYTAAILDGSGATEAPVRFLSPVAQADVSRQAVDLGLGASLQWFAILSCAIGVINLLPLPPLDGSHAVAATVEGVAQKLRPGRRVQLDITRFVPLAYLTIALLVALTLSALVLDLRDLAA